DAVMATVAILAEELCQTEIQLGGIKPRNVALVAIRRIDVKQSWFQRLGRGLAEIGGVTLERQTAVHREGGQYTVDTVPACAAIKPVMTGMQRQAGLEKITLADDRIGNARLEYKTVAHYPIRMPEAGCLTQYRPVKTANIVLCSIECQLRQACIGAI